MITKNNVIMKIIMTVKKQNDLKQIDSIVQIKNIDYTKNKKPYVHNTYIVYISVAQKSQNKLVPNIAMIVITEQ